MTWHGLRKWNSSIKTTQFWYTAANTSPECTGHFPHTEIGVRHSPAGDERAREVAAVVCPCGVKIKYLPCFIKPSKRQRAQSEKNAENCIDKALSRLEMLGFCCWISQCKKMSVICRLSDKLTQSPCVRHFGRRDKAPKITNEIHLCACLSVSAITGNVCTVGLNNAIFFGWKDTKSVSDWTSWECGQVPFLEWSIRPACQHDKSAGSCRLKDSASLSSRCPFFACHDPTTGVIDGLLLLHN